MTSKLSFRARALDATKPMAIYNQEDLPELPDIPAINRAVPALPTGMEKEEESEKHLQDILKSDSDDLVIPTPEVYEASKMELDVFEDLYKSDFRCNRTFIHVQPFAHDNETPDYDIDSEDEIFYQNILLPKFENLKEIDFEDMLDRLEKNSGHQIVSSRDAKLLLSQKHDELILTIYDYWVDKRLRLKSPLMYSIKSAETGLPSNSSGSTPNNNPYVCFRRRTEKMQTRKNRKNDEASYERMLKLRRDLNRAVTLLEMVKRREKLKKKTLELGADIFEKRYVAGDFEGKIVYDVRHRQPLGYLPDDWIHQMTPEESLKKRLSKKRRKRNNKFTASNNSSKGSNTTKLYSSSAYDTKNGPEFGTSISSDDDAISPSEEEEENEEEDNEDDEDGYFTFRRKRGCQYFAPHFDKNEYLWPWEQEEAKYRYSLASTSKWIGYTRRRIGRGGRVILDRAYSDYDELWNSLDFTITDDSRSHYGIFRPVTPPNCRDEDWDPYKNRWGDPPGSFPSTMTLKPLPFAAVQAATRSRIGLKTLDPVGALNAASALIPHNVLEMFDSKN